MRPSGPNFDFRASSAALPSFSSWEARLIASSQLSTIGCSMRSDDTFDGTAVVYLVRDNSTIISIGHTDVYQLIAPITLN